MTALLQPILVVCYQFSTQAHFVMEMLIWCPSVRLYGRCFSLLLKSGRCWEVSDLTPGTEQSLYSSCEIENWVITTHHCQTAFGQDAEPQNWPLTRPLHYRQLCMLWNACECICYILRIQCSPILTSECILSQRERALDQNGLFYLGRSNVWNKIPKSMMD